MNTKTKDAVRTLYSCPHCGDQFTVVDGRRKAALEVHEVSHCPVYWEQQDQAFD